MHLLYFDEGTLEVPKGTITLLKRDGSVTSKLSSAYKLERISDQKKRVKEGYSATLIAKRQNTILVCCLHLVLLTVNRSPIKGDV